MSIWVVPLATTSERTSITPDEGEILYDTDLSALFRGDGSTAGGVRIADFGGSGEANTGANINTGGVEVFDGKVGVELQFRGIAAATSKVSVAFDDPTNEIRIDVAEANLNLGSMGGEIATSQIADEAVTYAKMQHVSAASRLLGRGSAAGAGDVEEIQIGSGLSMSGTTLSATGGGGGDSISVNGVAATDADFDDVTPAAPGGDLNILWQKDAGTPNNISGYVDVSALEPLLTHNNLGGLTTGDPHTQYVLPSGTRPFDNTGLKVDDTGGDNSLTISPAENLTANRILSLNVGDADRLLTLTGDATISGTNTGDQTITLTGDVTGSGTGSFAATIANDAVTNAKLAEVADQTLKGNISGGVANPSDLTAAQVTAMLDVFTSSLQGVVPASGGGTTNFLRADGSWAAPAGGGNVSAGASIADNAVVRGDGGTTGVQDSGVLIDDTDNVTGMATLTLPNTGLHLLDTNASHDLVIAPGSDLTADRTLTLVTGDASRTLTLSGDTTLSGGTHSGTNTGDQTITLTGDVTGSGTGSFAATIANDVVTNAKLANVATATIKGRVTAATGDPEDLTGTQATTLLDVFTSSLKGLAPASGGGTTNFLRADGTWAAPPGGGGGDAVSVNGAAATDADLDDADPAAPAGDLNVKWQINTTPAPDSISAYVDVSELEPLVSHANLADLTTGDPHTQYVLPTGARPFDNTGLRVDDTGGDHYLQITPSENLTANRTLSVDVDDADRTLTISGNATVSGTNTGDQTITLTGDVTGSGTGSFAATIAAQAVGVAKMTVSASDRLLGRDTTGAGAAEELTVGGNLEFTGSGGIQRGALTGDVTASAGSGATTIATSSVTTAKIADSNVTNAKLSTNAKTTALQIVIGNGSDVITTGVKGYLQIPFHATITAWHLVADASGSIVIDVWKDTYANFPPTDADSIAGTELPTLSSVQKNQDTSLSSWTTDVNAEDWIGFNVDSATTVTQVTLVLSLTRHDG